MHEYIHNGPPYDRQPSEMYHYLVDGRIEGLAERVQELITNFFRRDDFARNYSSVGHLRCAFDNSISTIDPARNTPSGLAIAMDKKYFDAIKTYVETITNIDAKYLYGSEKIDFLDTLNIIPMLFDLLPNAPLFQAGLEAYLTPILNSKLSHESKTILLGPKGFNLQQLLITAIQSKNLQPLKCIFDIINQSTMDAKSKKDSLKAVHLEFINAGQHFNRNTLNFLIEVGVNIDELDNKGNTPFMLACQSGQIELVKFFIEKLGNIKPLDENNNTPFTLACQYGQSHLVWSLLQEASFKYQNKNGDTGLILAFKNNHLRLCESLLREDKEDFNARIACQNRQLDVLNFIIENISDSESRKRLATKLFIQACETGQGITAIDNSSCNSLDERSQSSSSPLARDTNTPVTSLELVKWFIEKNAYINCSNQEGNTALMLACKRGDLEIVKYLVEKKAYADIKNKEGYSALELACQSGHLEIVKLLKWKIKPDDRLLRIACESGHLNIVKFLLSPEFKGLPQRLGIKDSEELLTFAWKHKRLDIVQCLFQAVNESGYRLNLSPEYVKQLLEETCVGGQLGVFLQFLLREKKQEIDLSSHAVYKLLMLACENKRLNIVEILMPGPEEINPWTGAPYPASNPELSNITFSNEDANSLFRLACQKGNLYIVNLLIDKNVDINLSNEDADTPLVLAYRNKNLEIFNLLMENKNINFSDNHVNTACTLLMLVCQDGNLEMVKLLVEKGVSVYSLNKNKQTALMLASQNGHIEIIKFLLSKAGPSVCRDMKHLTDDEKNIFFNMFEKQKNTDFQLEILNAYKHGKINLFNFLIKSDWSYYLLKNFKFSFTAQDQDGKDIMDLALAGNDNATVECLKNEVFNILYTLCEYGNEPDFKDQKWMSRDFWMPESNSAKENIIKYLLGINSEPSANSANYALLSEAARAGANEIVDFLLELYQHHGATVNLLDFYKTLKLNDREENHQKIITLLINKGVSPLSLFELSESFGDRQRAAKKIHRAGETEAQIIAPELEPFWQQYDSDINPQKQNLVAIESSHESPQLFWDVPRSFGANSPVSSSCKSDEAAFSSDATPPAFIVPFSSSSSSSSGSNFFIKPSVPPSNSSYERDLNASLQVCLGSKNEQYEVLDQHKANGKETKISSENWKICQRYNNRLERVKTLVKTVNSKIDIDVTNQKAFIQLFKKLAKPPTFLFIPMQHTTESKLAAEIVTILENKKNKTLTDCVKALPCQALQAMDVETTLMGLISCLKINAIKQQRAVVDDARCSSSKLPGSYT